MPSPIPNADDRRDDMTGADQGPDFSNDNIIDSSQNNTSISPISPETPVNNAIASTADVLAPPTEEQIAAARDARAVSGLDSANFGDSKGVSGEGGEKELVRMAGATGSMGVFANHPQRSSASGTGDIILHNGPAVGGKKKWVILGVVSAVVLAIVVIVMVMVGGGSQTAKLDYKTSFNRYANYLLYGEDKTSPIEGEYDEGRSYELNLQIESDNYNETYWQTAHKLLDSAVDSYRDTVSDNSMSAIYLDYYREEFNFVEIYKQNDISPFSDKTIADVASMTQDDLRAMYAKFLESNNEDAIAYAEARISQYTALSELYNIYIGLGCINNEAVDDSCISGLDIDSVNTIEDILEKSRQADLVADDMIHNAIRNLKIDCWYFEEILQAEPSEGDEEEEGDIDEDSGDEEEDDVFGYSDEDDTEPDGDDGDDEEEDEENVNVDTENEE